MRRVLVAAVVLAVAVAGMARAATPRPVLTVNHAKEMAKRDEPHVVFHAARRVSAQYVRLRITLVFGDREVAGGELVEIWGPWWIDVFPRAINWAGCGHREFC